ncbi:hypothetical protein HNQ56_001206 [Anaerotaenia torta]|uniref:hypothetical protein n=1 Tax=Anaerotaenia torta TaxID=433293 RepID=UPI003D1E577E
MKKLILFIILLSMLTGCAKNNPVAKVDDGNVSVTPSAAPTDVAVPATATPIPTVTPETTPVEEPQDPILDEVITDKLASYMYSSFGGSGTEELAAGWYKYIDYFEVFQEENFYTGNLHLKERPLDASAQLILSQYYPDDGLDILCPILLDTGAALDLDDLDLCLIGEALYKISAEEDAKTQYYSLAALNIPIYDFLASASGWKIADVKNAVSNNEVSGDIAFEILVDYIADEYKDAFDGLSMEMVKHMSMAALANFEDVRIETLAVFDQDGKAINTYKN